MKGCEAHEFDWVFTGKAIPATPGIELVGLHLAADGKGDDGCNYWLSRDTIHAWGTFSQRLLDARIELALECRNCGAQDVPADLREVELRPMISEGHCLVDATTDYRLSDESVIVGAFRRGEIVDPILLENSYAEARGRRARRERTEGVRRQ